MIGRLIIDVSIMKACVEEIIIEDLVLIVGPDATKADRNFDLTPAQRQSMILELVEKYKAYAKWKQEVELLEAELNLPENQDNMKLKKLLERKISSYKPTAC